MKTLLFTILFISFTAYAQDKEGDLQLPVTDISNAQKEEEKIPTIDEVPMYEDKKPKNEVESKQDKKSKKSSR